MIKGLGYLASYAIKAWNTVQYSPEIELFRKGRLATLRVLQSAHDLQSERSMFDFVGALIAKLLQC
eukprot:6458205-Amphidinium_carterae.1